MSKSTFFCCFLYNFSLSPSPKQAFHFLSPTGLPEQVFHSLKSGLTHIGSSGLSHTTTIGVSQTAFEALS